MRTKVKSVLRVAGLAFLSISLLVVPLAFADTWGGTQGNHILDDDVADTPRGAAVLEAQFRSATAGGSSPGSGQRRERRRRPSLLHHIRASQSEARR